MNNILFQVILIIHVFFPGGWRQDKIAALFQGKVVEYF